MTPAQYQNDDVGGTISNDCSPSSGVEADKPIAKPTSDSVATSLKIAPDAAIAVGRVEPREEGRGSLVDTCSAEKVDQTLNAGQAPEAMDSAEKEMSKSAAELQGAQTSSQPTGIEVEGQAALDMPSSSLPISASQDTVATDGRKADSYCSPGEEQEQNVEDTANAKRPSLMPMESNKEVTEKEFIATQGARVGNRACDMETAEDRTAVVAPAQVSAGSQSEASKVVIPANATTEPDSPSQRGVPALKSLQAASGIHANKNNTSPDRSTAAEGHGEERQEGGPYAKVPEEGRKEEPKAVDPQKRIEGNGGNRDVQRVRGEGHTYEIQVMGMDKESDETRASEAGTTNSRLIATLGEGQKVTIGSQNAKENNSEESSATQKSDIAKGQAEKHHVVDPVWSEQPEARGLDQTTTGQKVPQGDGGNVPMDVEVGPAHVVRSSSVVSMDISPTATPQPDANGPVESERDPPVNLREVTMNRVKALIEPNEGVVESLIRKLNLASRIRQIQNKDFIIGSVVVSAKQLSMLANVNPVMISTELDDFLKAEENGQSWEMTPKVRAVVNLLYRIFVLGKFPCTGQGTLSPWVTGESGQPPAIKILTKSKVEEVSPSLTQASSSQGPVAKKKKAVKPAQVIGWENIYTKSSKVPGSSKQGVGKRAVRETSSVQSGETSSNHLKAGSLKNALGSGGSQPGPVQSSSSSKKRKAASPEPESSPSELTADDAHFLERRVSKLDPNDSDRIKVAELIQLRLNTMQELGQAIKIRLSKKLRDEVKSLAKAWHREKETVVKASSPQVSLAVESERPNDKAAIKSTSPANLEAGPTVAPSENEKQQSEPVNFENERSKEKRPLLAKISAPGCSLAHAIELSDDSDNDRTQDRPFKPPGATVTQDIYKRPIPAHPIGGSAPVADTESRAPLHQQSRTIKQLLAMETLPRLLHTRSKDFEGSTGKELLRQVTSYEQVPDLMAKFSFMDLWNVVMSQPTVCEQIEKITHWQKGVGDGFFSEEAGGGGGGSDL
ncbi:hypothetical protein IE53DRAFT_365939 [Violaceomyces palustris]|uniref:Uncharacterized protein n=1 Tax=Violaceomyces palustris TaxID=1673888 RepID=A0ACD0P7J3_9BASI|nr:hypothetical protein IE53DRAFT_365939 [Violaceomyces palustris]